MKIAYVTPSYHPAYVYGGPTYSALKLSIALARAGCDVRVLTTDANGRELTVDVDTAREQPFEAGLRVRYCHRIAVDSVSPAFIGALPEVVAWADVIHLTAVYNFTTLPTLLAAKSARKRLVWTPRGALLRWRGSTRRGAKEAWEFACRRLMPRRAALHVTSDREAEQSSARFPRLPTFVIPNGVEIAISAARRPSSTLRLLFLGRLDPIKALDNLLAACARLDRRRLFEWRLVIAGDGDARFAESLRSDALRLGIADRVSFTGSVEGREKEALFDAADVFVMASHSENFGNVVTEALAHGVAVIASRGTPWARLEDMGCGLWVQNDPQALCAAIEKIHGMPRLEMGERGRRWMEAEFSWAHVARRTIEMYERI